MAQRARAPRLVPSHRPHPRANCGHHRHRGKRLCVPHGRRPVLRHLAPERLRPPRPPRHRGPTRRPARRSRAEAPPHGLRAVEVQPGRGTAADGMGQPVGARLPRLAHRMHRYGGQVLGAVLRHPLRRRGSRPGPPHQRDRPSPSLLRHAAGRILAPRRVLAARRGEDVQVERRLPAPRIPRRKGLRSPRLPLFLPRGALPRQALLHLGKSQRRGYGLRPAARRRPRLGCAV